MRTMRMCKDKMRPRRHEDHEDRHEEAKMLWSDVELNPEFVEGHLLRVCLRDLRVFVVEFI
jgi:hypothetical protein